MSQCRGDVENTRLVICSHKEGQAAVGTLHQGTSQPLRSPRRLLALSRTCTRDVVNELYRLVPSAVSASSIYVSFDAKYLRQRSNRRWPTLVL